MGMNNIPMQGLIKAMMMKEALISCQMEGIGLDLILEDLYLAELKIYQSERKKKQVCAVLDEQKGSGGKDAE